MHTLWCRDQRFDVEVQWCKLVAFAPVVESEVLVLPGNLFCRADVFPASCQGFSVILLTYNCEQFCVTRLRHGSSSSVLLVKISDLKQTFW